ncbi:hypothetical protein Tco_0878771 [Tanacetum coccineum]|uniref:Uncharacterized protein n=1 Tax=Tanacetum coccineum TaxID=301880 RepID=A0ABQ5BYS6_9ASTR
MFLNVDQLEKQLDKEEFQDIGSMSAFNLEYTQLEVQEFRDTLIQHMEYVKKSIDKRALQKREYDNRVNEKCSKTNMEKQDTSSRSGNDANADNADIKPVYNVFATGQQHTEQPEFNKEGDVDQDAKQNHDIRPLPAKLFDNEITKLSNQSLESENNYLKKTVAQFQKDFSKLEAHCINLDIQLQNNVLKSGQQSQFLKAKSDEAKVKKDINVFETINIELEYSVAKLLKENETLKKHYKDLYDSIKVTRTKTIEQTTSLIAKNDEFKAQL